MENILQEFLGNLTPSDLDELAPAGFDAKAPRGALKRIGKAAVEKTEIRAKKRKTRLKPLMIAAAAIVASTATLFTVNAATGGGLVKFLFNGEEYSGDTSDYVDENGFRHMTFDAVVPVEAESFAIIFDMDEPDREKAVRVLTDDNDPEFLDKLRTHNETNMQIFEERNALKETGVDSAELPDLLGFEDFGIVLKDSEICIYEVASENDSTLCGAFMTAADAAKWNVGTRSIVNRVIDGGGTRIIHEEIEYYVGLD